jgi:coatomer subunit delta
MVIISSAICSKQGKALFSRQYSEISRVRIEGLLSAFPKLMDSNNQQTFVETENVRYVYQPMEKLYLLLITNKSSNIIEDLETLNLLANIVNKIVNL